MRLRELRLQKYGSIAEQRLRFADGPGLSIIYGANEAGKSTSLAALTDFLFGIAHISAHTAHFGPEGMRIGATLETADGREIVLERRRGRSKTPTLLDGEGVLRGEHVLQAMLGTTTRERFKILFGLNHESLRTGGDALLAADGEIGRLIVEAGGGLSTLMSRLDELDTEAASYYAPHAAKSRAFYQARDAFNQAQADIDRLELSYQAFQKAQSQALQATRVLEAHKQTREVRTQQVLEAVRLTKVVPEIVRLDSLHTQLEQDKAVAGFGADFDAHVQEALQRRAQAQQLLDEAQIQHTAAQAACDTLLPVNQMLIDAEAPIRDALHSARAVRASEAQMHRLVQSLEQHADALKDVGLRLGFGNAELSLAQVPKAQALEEVRRLVEAQKSLSPLLRERQARLQTAQNQQQALKTRVSQALERGLLQPLGLDVEALRPIASIQAALVARQEKSARAHKALQDAVQKMGLDSFAQLQALTCPQPAHVDQSVDESRRLEQLVLSHTQAKLARQAEYAAAKAELAALAAKSALVTHEQVHAARAQRDLLLDVVATGFVNGASSATPESRHNAVEAARAAICQADELVDSQSQQAKRLAEIEMCQLRLTTARAACQSAEAQAQLVETAHKTHHDTWRAAFAEACALQPSLIGLQRLVHWRQDMLVRHAALVDDDEQRHAEAAQLALLLVQLSQAEARLQLCPEPHAPVVSRRDAVFAAIQEHEHARRDVLREQAELVRLEAESAAAQAQLAAMQQTAAQTQKTWAAAISAAGLPPETSLDEASSWTASCVQAREVLVANQADQAQLAQLRAAEARLQQATQQLAERLKIPASASPLATAEWFATRLEEAKQLNARHQAAKIALAQSSQHLEQRHAAVTQTQKSVDALSQKAQLPPGDTAALRRAAARFASYQALLGERERSLRLVATLAEGHSLEALRQAWGGRDAEALAADAAKAAAARQSVEHDIEAAWHGQKEAADILQQFEGDNGVNLAHAQRAQATAQLHAAAERYMQLSVAKELIATAMNTLRSARKSPLVQRASQLFAATTQGQYAGVETDVDLKGEPIVVGRRPDGATVKVATMSDGTRDQLFLAFRLASLEAYAEQAEALPFVADDILVHFDDSRGAATLNVLAQFALKSQVLLFTHHQSVVDAAQPLVAKGLAQVVCLAR